MVFTALVHRSHVLVGPIAEITGDTYLTINSRGYFLIDNSTSIRSGINGNKIISGRITCDISAIGSAVTINSLIGSACTTKSIIPIEIRRLYLPLLSCKIVEVGNFTGTGHLIIIVIALHEQREATFARLITPSTVTKIISDKIPHNRSGIRQFHIIRSHTDFYHIRCNGIQSIHTFKHKCIDTNKSLLFGRNSVCFPLRYFSQSLVKFRCRQISKTGCRSLVDNCIIGNKSIFLIRIRFVRRHSE